MEIYGFLFLIGILFPISLFIAPIYDIGAMIILCITIANVVFTFAVVVLSGHNEILCLKMFLWLILPGCYSALVAKNINGG